MVSNQVGQQGIVHFCDLLVRVGCKSKVLADEAFLSQVKNCANIASRLSRRRAEKIGWHLRLPTIYRHM
jgi:hypothetical protein